MRLIWQFRWGSHGDEWWCDMPYERAIELESLFVNSTSVYAYIGVYRYDFVYMLQLNLATGFTRPVRRLVVVNM